MIRGSTIRMQLFVALVILAAAVAAGCAAKKALWGDPETGLILTYRMAKDQVVKYESSNESVQILQIMGQDMEVKSSKTYAFSLAPKGLKKGNHELAVTIDSMEMNVGSPQGELTPDMSAIVGKSFAMSLSPLGRELDVSGAEALKYSIGPSGERSVAPDFEAIFPDLAGKPVKIGDTWTSRDTLDVKEGDSDIKIVLKSVNTLKALETINGLECARMEAAVTGKLTGTGQQGGATLSFEGDIAGTDVWHFAYKEGLFVKMVSDATIKGTITASGPQSMDIPMTQTMKIETSMVPQPM